MAWKNGQANAEALEHNFKKCHIVPDDDKNKLWHRTVRHLPPKEDLYLSLSLYDTDIYTLKSFSFR